MRDSIATPVDDRLSDRFGRRMDGWPPALVAALVAVIGIAVAAALLAAVGLLMTKVLTPGPVARWDESVDQWFAARRTATWNTLTDYASIFAGTGTVLAIVGVTAVILAFKRLWWEIAFLLIGFAVELSGFFIAVLVVNRPRPSVPHMDPLPLTSSYPSGHTAAAIVLYVGLAMIVAAHTRSRALHGVLYAIAIALVVGVGLSRVYRGMHHPTDVLAGVILGVLALSFALVGARAGAAAARDRERESAPQVRATAQSKVA
jgi:membrane-associated phospholipid phosphatase